MMMMTMMMTMTITMMMILIFDLSSLHITTRLKNCFVWKSETL